MLHGDPSDRRQATPDQALIVLLHPAPIRGRDQAAERADLAPIPQIATEEFLGEHRRTPRRDPLEPRQPLRHPVRRRRGLPHLLLFGRAPRPTLDLHGVRDPPRLEHPRLDRGRQRRVRPITGRRQPGRELRVHPEAHTV